jgi:branched-chain amino acid transport system substrate-binding protein
LIPHPPAKASRFPERSRHAAAFLRDGLALGGALAAAWLNGCAAPRPSPIPIEPAPSKPETSEPQPVESSDVSQDARRLFERGEYERAEALLRAEIDSPEAAGNEARLTLLLGEVLERQGRGDEAIVQFCRASGSEGDAEVAPEAWDAMARLRAAGGDRAGAVRARMIAWDRADEPGRKRRGAELRREIRELRDPELRAISRAWPGLASQSFVLEELERRAHEAKPGQEYVVELLAPLSGKFANFGEAFRLGARLALESRDAAADSVPGGPTPVRLLERDTEGDLLTATRAAREAILQDGAGAILGPLLSVTAIGAGGVAQAYGVPLLAPIATDPRLSEIGPYVLTLDPSPRELTEPLAKFSIEVLGNTRHGVLVARDGVSERLEEAFREVVERLGGMVVVSVAFDPGERDFRRLLERFDEAAVDAVYVPGSAADLEALAPQLEFYDFRRRVLGNGGWTGSRVLDSGNTALEGAIFCVEAADDPNSPFLERLREQVRRESGEEVSRFHVRGFQAMETLLASIDQGARSGEEIVELLHRREHWPSRPEGERIQILTYRDGVLGPATWAAGFDLAPRTEETGEPPAE